MTQRRFVVVILWACGVMLNASRTASDESASGEAHNDDHAVAEWIRGWDEDDYATRRTATDSLAAMGAPAADALGKLIGDRHRHSDLAIQTLAKMGAQAKGAMPVLLELAADREVQDPEGWTSNQSIRWVLFSRARTMVWAADEWIPVLGRVAQDESEGVDIRRIAIAALGEMGADARPILQQLKGEKDDAVRLASYEALAPAAGQAKVEFYTSVVEQHPLDPNVSQYLVRMKERYNNGQIHAPTQRVKAALRQRLRQQPSAELAWTLAVIIRNGLANSDLDFSAPSNVGRSRWDREDPSESFATLAEALEICLEHAPDDSELAGRSGRSLARLRLMQGDWHGMNAVLEKLGQKPIPAERPSLLPAPPFDWSNLFQDWQPADDSFRSGNCAIEFQFEKDGRGLAGAHVLVKRLPEPEHVFRSGIPVDTLLHATQPLEAHPYDAFGYRAGDRAMTRYGVSDGTGKIRIEGLPKIPILVEVLIPMGNFPERGNSWDLLMEVAEGDVLPVERGRPKSVSRSEPPAVATLKEGATVRYPKFIVQPHLMLNVADWSEANPYDFVLQWQDPEKPVLNVDHYELEMMLSAPSQHPDSIAQQRVIRSTTEEVRGTRWRVDDQGVGGQRLRSGNVYMFEVRGIDAEGKVVARLPRTRVWVPWEHRQSLPPAHGNGPMGGAPIHDRVWWQGATTHSDGKRTELREAVAKYLLLEADDFEYEYVLLGQAWLFYLDGATEAGREILEDLAHDLPEGNVVRGTARALVQQLDAKEPLSKRLEFVADE